MANLPPDQLRSPQTSRPAATAFVLLVLIGVIATIVLPIGTTARAQSSWAFEETFDGDPASPSQDLLPRTFDYAVTHRTHPKEHFTIDFPEYPADHDDTCAGPNPTVTPLPQHLITTDQRSNGDDPDDSFFICKNHMMSSMGEVGPYSVSAFWPRQEFNFADGGNLEFEVNVNIGHENRSWWEIMIVPREHLKVAAGPVESAIDETYPTERIVLDFRRLVRRVKVGTAELAPNGWLANEREFFEYDHAYWNVKHDGDPALEDRRVRRTMRVRLENDRVIWGIELENGTFDEFEVAVPGGLPFDQGLVVFKTHAYTPSKNENYDTFTFHWDNIRFDGPVVGRYDTHYADDVVYLQRNGDRPIGDNQTVTIDLDDTGGNPVLFGQIHEYKHGQVQLSINGRPNIGVTPYEYEPSGCPEDEWNDWKSFRLELDPSWLVAGTNSFKWTIAPRPACPPDTQQLWDGFSVKSLHIQTDADDVAPPASEPPSSALPTCGGLAATVQIGLGQVPTDGPDVIVGTPGDDAIAAGAGDDIVCGLGGDDVIRGQAGDDAIYGGDGDDKLRGSDGDDRVEGQGGRDDLNGGRGNDYVDGGPGDDVVVRGATGDDQVLGGPGNDGLVAGNGGSDTIRGGDGNDTVTGGPRPDTLFGDAGADLLRGLGGADVLHGGAGDDDLRGGQQRDSLDGGDGTDTCRGGTTSPTAPEADTATACETVATVP